MTISTSTDWIERFTTEVRPQLAGPSFLPGEAGYDAERAVFNVVMDHHPSVIVGVTGVADVLASVRFAGEHGLPVGVLATGHTAGVPADGAVLLNTSRMQGVWIHPERRTARVEAGVRWERVVREAAEFGLAPLNGSSLTVGVVGYTLGGGIGLLGRKHGFAADRVRSLDVVTADGTFRQVTPERDEDLYWGLLGGKGNLGVVTSIEFELVELSQFYGGGLFFPGESAAEVLHAYRGWVATVPEELTSSVALLRIPPAYPGVPEVLLGRFVVHVRIAYVGPAEEGARLLKPLRECAEPIVDTVAEMPYTAVATIHNDPVDPLPLVDMGMFLSDVDAGTVQALIEVAGPDVDSPLLLVDLRHLGGALTHRQGPPNAVGNRQWPFVLFGAGVGVPDLRAAVEDNLNSLMRRLEPWSAGKRFVNFLGHLDTDPLQVRTAYDDADYARLASIKSKYDSTNMFRLNHNVPPESLPG